MLSDTPDKAALLVAADNWIKGKGQKYACARDYPHAFDPTCEGCIIVAARTILSRPADAATTAGDNDGR